MSLGALAADTALLGELTSGAANLGENYWCISIDLTVALRGAAQGEGPIALYLAHSDYTVAEVEEHIEGSTQYSPKDMVGREIARRKIRHFGVFDMDTVRQSLNDGLPIRVKIGWMCPEGQNGVNLVAYNTDTSALTTGAIISHQSTWFGRWVY